MSDIRILAHCLYSPLDRFSWNSLWDQIVRTSPTKIITIVLLFSLEILIIASCQISEWKMNWGRKKELSPKILKDFQNCKLGFLVLSKSYFALLTWTSPFSGWKKLIFVSGTSNFLTTFLWKIRFWIKDLYGQQVILAKVHRFARTDYHQFGSQIDDGLGPDCLIYHARPKLETGQSLLAVCALKMSHSACLNCDPYFWKPRKDWDATLALKIL